MLEPERESQESFISFPVVPSNSTTLLAIAEAGHTTSPALGASNVGAEVAPLLVRTVHAAPNVAPA